MSKPPHGTPMRFILKLFFSYDTKKSSGHRGAPFSHFLISIHVREFFKILYNYWRLISGFHRKGPLNGTIGQTALILERTPTVTVEDNSNERRVRCAYIINNFEKPSKLFF